MEKVTFEVFYGLSIALKYNENYSMRCHKGGLGFSIEVAIY